MIVCRKTLTVNLTLGIFYSTYGRARLVWVCTSLVLGQSHLAFVVFISLAPGSVLRESTTGMLAIGPNDDTLECSASCWHEEVIEDRDIGQWEERYHARSM